MAIEQRFTDLEPRSFKLPATIRTFSEQSIINFVMDRDNEARFARAHTTLRDNYTELRNAYNGKFKRGQGIPKWRNRLYNRLSFKIVETMRAFMDDSFPFHAGLQSANRPAASLGQGRLGYDPVADLSAHANVSYPLQYRPSCLPPAGDGTG